MTRRPRHRRGFTIVESIAVMTVLGVIGSIASGLIYMSVSSYRDASVQGQIHEEQATAIARLGVEFRKIPLNPLVVGQMAPDISSVAATSLAWNSGYSLALSGNQLQLTEPGGSAQALLQDVSSVTIQCYDESNAALGATLSGAGCYPIRRISISVTSQRQGISETLRCRFFIRSAMQGGTP